MKDMWNPWHGCKKISEGCQNCYMYSQDAQRGLDGSRIYRVKGDFTYPLQKNRDGSYKVKSGEILRVCMTSDFFLKEADSWREEAWEMIRQRQDVLFFLLTKRPERAEHCLPKDWGNGWDNVWLNVTAENQKRADERIPRLLSLPFRYKGVMVAPFLGPVSLRTYLKDGQIRQVIAEGENYTGARPLCYEWVEQLSQECAAADVAFDFHGIGSNFIKDGKRYCLFNKKLQQEMADKSGLSVMGTPIKFSQKLVSEPKQLDLFESF